MGKFHVSINQAVDIKVEQALLDLDQLKSEAVLKAKTNRSFAVRLKIGVLQQSKITEENSKVQTVDNSFSNTPRVQREISNQSRRVLSDSSTNSIINFTKGAPASISKNMDTTGMSNSFKFNASRGNFDLTNFTGFDSE